MEVVVAPVRVAAELGACLLVLTNACGGVDPALAAGSLVLLDDHIDLTFRSALRGPTADAEQRFPDMSAPYDPDMQALAVHVAATLGIALPRGTYAGLLGPSYETRAEVRMLHRLGAHVVGMSTVAEAITARALGLRCLAFSVVTNAALGDGSAPLDHADVVAAASRAADELGRILAGVVERLPAAPQPVGAK
jgi:purine-nucleoside phosphorylase